MEEMLEINISPEQYAAIQPDQGLGYRRVAFGDYTLEIAECEIIPSKNNPNPHNMLKVTFRVKRARDEANATEIGSQLTGLYAGSNQSPPFMKKRFKALCEAVKVAPQKGSTGIKVSQLIGKELDASVVWEMSEADKLDELGNKKFWVNDRVKAERPVGTERPAGCNPKGDSQKAVQYLDRGVAATDTVGDQAPWEAPADTTVVGDTQTPAGWLPEEQAIAQGAHLYRAVIKLGGEEGAQARQMLIDAGIDPDGPIDVRNLTDETVKAAYVAKFAPATAAPSRLPPLGAGNGRRTGVRAPRA